jgi:HSP20 family molecular chaperone IbpA
MAKIRHLVIGGAIGAGIAYFLDPELGPGRRARLQNQFEATLSRGKSELDRAARQLQGRAQGAVAQLQAAAAPAPEDDLTLLSRVESVLHAVPGFPRSTVEAEVVDGRLILRGEVDSADQAREIVQAASQIRNIAAVESLLQVRGEQAPNKAASRRIQS